MFLIFLLKWCSNHHLYFEKKKERLGGRGSTYALLCLFVNSNMYLRVACASGALRGGNRVSWSDHIWLVLTLGQSRTHATYKKFSSKIGNMNGAVWWAGTGHRKMCVKTCLCRIMAVCRAFRVIFVVCLLHFDNAYLFLRRLYVFFCVWKIIGFPNWVKHVNGSIVKWINNCCEQRLIDF